MTTPRQHSSIDPATEVGVLSLTVADLERSLAFYTGAIGFQVLYRGDGEATLAAAGTPLLHLHEALDAAPWPHDRYGHTGLYHFAILMPTRADLGRWLRHWLEIGLPVPGQGDHLVSEALYLSDPDGHGIEIYRDRPRDQWQWVNGQVRMGTGPVDVRGLIEEADRDDKPWSGLAAGTRLGHMHLQVGDIPQAVAFYHGVLGFDIVAQMPSALFLSAGGYHHHIGMNTWHSQGAQPAPANTAALRFFTIQLPHESARREVLDRLEEAGIAYSRDDDVVVLQDPWHNIILLHVGAISDAAAASRLEAVFAARGNPAPVS